MKSNRVGVIALVILLCVLFSLLGIFVATQIVPYFTSDNSLTAEEIYNLVSSSVVEINGEGRGFSSTGTGFFYDNIGTVITNYHVIEKCTSASITLANGAMFKVDKVLGYDIERDIAILSTTCKQSTPLKIRSTSINTGETVYAIGSSLGLTGSLSNGIVSTAERYIDGQVFIQTTTPISHGNSGGPLFDDKGEVIGITSASFVEGQNLNLAIPISEVTNINTNNPTALNDLFKPEVQWISRRTFLYYEEEDSFVLLFELADEDEIPMTSSGTVNIRIVNDDETVVYEQVKLFSEHNFETWYIGGDEEYLVAAIYIDPQEINPGTTSEGDIYFTVEGEEYYFEEYSLSASELPTLPIYVEISQTPKTLTQYDYRGYVDSKVRIDDIAYEVVYGDSLCISFSGTKTYDISGDYNSDYCVFAWKLYDSDGYLLDSGTVYTDMLTVGDKFKDEYVYVYDCIEPGQSYKLVLLDYQ